MSNKADKINTTPPRGMRDHLPEDLLPRLKVIEKLKRTFRLYGFQPLETPALERLEVLAGKSGDEAEKLTYLVMKRGDELKRAYEELSEVKPDGTEGSKLSTLADMGLRYEFTVSLARVYAQYQSKLPVPFKRYQIGPVWRADRPQKGRYREFVQCDVDIVGTESMLADAELISLAVDALTELEMPPFEVHVNNRKLLSALSIACGNTPDRFKDFCIALDKLDKIGADGVTNEMKERGLAHEKLPQLWELTDSSHQRLEELIGRVEQFTVNVPQCEETTNSLKELFKKVSLLGVKSDKFVFNPTLARGLDYYTGTVFEAVLKDGSSGSVLGGGRYDELIGIFSGRPVPAVGFSFGLDRLLDVLSDAGRIDQNDIVLDVVLLDLEGNDESLEYAGWIVRKLREHKVSCELYHKPGVKPGKGLQAVDKRGVPFAILIGSGELSSYKRGDASDYKITVKHLASGEQKELSLNEAVRWITNNT